MTWGSPTRLAQLFSRGLFLLSPSPRSCFDFESSLPLFELRLAPFAALQPPAAYCESVIYFYFLHYYVINFRSRRRVASRRSQACSSFFGRSSSRRVASHRTWSFLIFAPTLESVFLGRQCISVDRSGQTHYSGASAPVVANTRREGKIASLWICFAVRFFLFVKFQAKSALS